MKFHELADMALIPEKERILNYSLKVKMPLLDQTREFYLMALTEKEGKITLWSLEKTFPEPAPFSDRISGRKTNTNRFHLRSSTQMRDIDCSIKQISIQGKTLKSSRGHGGFPQPPWLSESMMLQHFAEHGLNFPDWSNICFENLYYSVHTYDLPDSEVDWDADLDLKITVDFRFPQLLIEQPFSMPFGKLENPQKHSYWSALYQREETFYILGLEHYDYKKDLIDTLNTRNRKTYYPNTDEEVILFDKTLTDDMDFALLTYSIKDDFCQQLDFYPSDYLSQPHKSLSTMTRFFFRSAPEELPEGFRVRREIVGIVPKDFHGDFDFELFSAYEHTPDQTFSIPNAQIE